MSWNLLIVRTAYPIAFDIIAMDASPSHFMDFSDLLEGFHWQPDYKNAPNALPGPPRTLYVYGGGSRQVEAMTGVHRYDAHSSSGPVPWEEQAPSPGEPERWVFSGRRKVHTTKDYIYRYATPSDVAMIVPVLRPVSVNTLRKRFLRARRRDPHHADLIGKQDLSEHQDQLFSLVLPQLLPATKSFYAAAHENEEVVLYWWH